MTELINNSRDAARAVPAVWRRRIYLAYLALTPFFTYAQVKGWLGSAELALWGSMGAVVSGLAAANVKTQETF